MFCFSRVSLNVCIANFRINLKVDLQLQGILVPKLTLGPFLTLSVRNGPNLQSYLFQEKNKITPYIYKKWLKLYIETINVNIKLTIRCEN